MSHRTKLQLYTIMIRPIVCYACETWTLTKVLEKKLEVFENSILRRILGPIFDNVEQQWRQRYNAELRQESGLPLITSYVRSCLRWAGHVARRPDDNLCRRYMVGRPEGRRPVGRPRLRWKDAVVGDLRQLGVEEAEDWMRTAQDRRRWRALVEAAKDYQGLQPPEQE